MWNESNNGWCVICSAMQNNFLFVFWGNLISYLLWNLCQFKIKIWMNFTRKYTIRVDETYDAGMDAILVNY